MFEPSGIEAGSCKETGEDEIWEVLVNDGVAFSPEDFLWSRLSRDVLPDPLGPRSRKSGVVAVRVEVA